MMVDVITALCRRRHWRGWAEDWDLEKLWEALHFYPVGIDHDLR